MKVAAIIAVVDIIIHGCYYEMALHVITDFDFFMGQWNISTQASFIALIKDRVLEQWLILYNAVSSHSSIPGSLQNIIPCTLGGCLSGFVCETKYHPVEPTCGLRYSSGSIQFPCTYLCTCLIVLHSLVQTDMCHADLVKCSAYFVCSYLKCTPVPIRV